MRKLGVMTRLNSPGYDLLAELIREKTAIPETGQGLINTRKVLVDLACACAETSPLGHRETLERFCRKIEVARCIRSSYESDWTKHDGSEKLAGEWLEMLAGVFLAACDAIDGDSSCSGLKLKHLNSAMTALDVAGETGGNNVDQLRKWASAILASVNGDTDFSEVGE